MRDMLALRLTLFTCGATQIAAAVGATVIALLVFGTTAVGAGTGAPTRVAGIGAERLGNSYLSGSGYARYSYVTVGIADAAAAGALETTSLVYTSGTSVPTTWNSGVAYDQALANDWLLKDAGGRYVKNASYGRYVGDFGNRAYQQAFIAWALGFLAQNGNEGIVIDDVVCDAPGLTGDVYPVRYPNQKAWENAQIAFVSKIGDELKAHGYYVMVNANCFIRGNAGSDDGSLTAAFWRRLAPHVSGLSSEYWLQLATDPTRVRVEGTEWTDCWSGWQNLINVAQSGGADFFAEMYGTGTSLSIMRYGKASFLLDWNGKGGAFLYQPDDGTSDPWNPEWTMDIGVPTGAKYRVGAGWRRDYTAGTVLLNANRASSQHFALGTTYFAADGTAVRSVTLEPGEGQVLQRSP
jgi:hypothetical protein